MRVWTTTSPLHHPDGPRDLLDFILSGTIRLCDASIDHYAAALASASHHSCGTFLRYAQRVVIYRIPVGKDDATPTVSRNSSASDSGTRLKKTLQTMHS